MSGVDRLNGKFVALTITSFFPSKDSGTRMSPSHKSKLKTFNYISFFENSLVLIWLLIIYQREVDRRPLWANRNWNCWCATFCCWTKRGLSDLLTADDYSMALSLIHLRLNANRTRKSREYLNNNQILTNQI